VRPLSRSKVEHLDCLLIFGRKKQAAAVKIDAKMIQITSKTWQRRARN
jgi:hypothetical protein